MMKTMCIFSFPVLFDIIHASGMKECCLDCTIVLFFPVCLDFYSILCIAAYACRMSPTLLPFILLIIFSEAKVRQENLFPLTQIKIF